MPPIQITRAEYEKKFGVKPIASSTSILEDEKPAPLRITRAEWNALQEQWKPQETQGLGSKLKERGADILNSGSADRTLSQPMRPELRGVGALAGGINDIISAAISPIIKKTTDALSDSPLLQKIATNKTVGKGLDATNKAIDFASDSWASFEEANPTAAQDIRDITNIASLAPAPRVVKPLVTKADDLIAPIKKNLDERGVNNVIKEIDQIENKYVKTRNANSYSKDIEASQRRIAESNVLDGSVDNNGLLQTKVSGGAIDQYKAQTIDGYEDIVRRKLADTKETALFDDVGKALKIEIGRSGLEAADLVTALKKIEKELEGLRIRTKGSSIIDLAYLQDAKIATTKNINYLTPPEKATYRKAVARAYKVLIEKNSTKFDVKAVNEGPLARAYEDIARLERLDGARAEGGRLGKATASLAGTAIGMVAGSAGGPLTAAAAGVFGGELAQVMKGAGMSRTFKGGGKGLTPDPLLVQTKLSIADKPMKAKAGIAKTKEIKELESQIAKNVADQKKAIAKGDFALVKALKEIYEVLVEELKKVVKYLNDNASLGLSIRKTVTPESVAKKADSADIQILAKVIDDPSLAKTDPDVRRVLSDMGLGRATEDEIVRFAKEVIDKKDGVAMRTVNTDPLLTEAKKYKTPEELMNALVKEPLDAGIDRKNLAEAYRLGDSDNYIVFKRTGKTIEEPVIVEQADGKTTTRYEKVPELEGRIVTFDENVDSNLYNAFLRAKDKTFKVTAGNEELKSQLTDIWKKANRVVQRKNEDKNALMSDQNQATNAPTTAQSISDTVPPVGNVSTDLLEEAKKYKSAEEFVNKEPSYFHATKAENVSLIEKQGFSGKVGDMSRASGGTMQEGVFLYPEKSSAEVFGKNFKSPSVLETKVNGKIYDANTNTKYGWEDNLQTQEIAKDPKIISQLKKDGYVGVKSTELGTDAVFVFDKSAVKTKSQLTDIWKKANRKASEDER